MQVTHQGIIKTFWVGKDQRCVQPPDKQQPSNIPVPDTALQDDCANCQVNSPGDFIRDPRALEREIKPKHGDCPSPS